MKSAGLGRREVGGGGIFGVCRGETEVYGKDVIEGVSGRARRGG